MADRLSVANGGYPAKDIQYGSPTPARCRAFTSSHSGRFRCAGGYSHADVHTASEDDDASHGDNVLRADGRTHLVAGLAASGRSIYLAEGYAYCNDSRSPLRSRIGSRDANDRAAVRPVPARENDGPVKRCAHGGTDMS